MKIYPSIPRLGKQKLGSQPWHTFAKVDGSNLRAEWEVGKGWVRFGTRHLALTPNHATLGFAIELFQESLAEPLTRIAYKRWPAMVAFFEISGEHSFAGEHEPNEPKSLTLFDVSVHRKGILGPVEFLKYFSGLNIPNYLGELVWDQKLIEQVHRGCLPGMSFEGVVGKQGSGHHLEMVKAKNRAWIRQVRERYGEAKLIELEGEGTDTWLGREMA